MLQLQGVFTPKRRVLAENTTLHEVYASVVGEFLGVEVVIEEPKFLRDIEKFDAKKQSFWMVIQLTPSGTLDVKLIPAPVEKSKEQLERDKKEQARVRILANRTAPPTDPTSVSDEEIEAEMDKMDKEKSKDKSAKKVSAPKPEDSSTIKADIVDGKIKE